MTEQTKNKTTRGETSKEAGQRKEKPEEQNNKHQNKRNSPPKAHLETLMEEWRQYHSTVSKITSALPRATICQIAIACTFSL